MGNIDIAAKELMKHNTFFADAVNFYLYQGKKVILPEHLHEADSAQAIMISVDSKKPIGKERYRDVIKKVEKYSKTDKIIFMTGFENQSYVNRAMPVRNMLYDSLSYIMQVKEKSKSTDFFTDLPKDEKLIPVITIVINFGQEPWNEPLSLHELLDCEEKDFLRYFPDYHLHLIDPHKMSDDEINMFDSNLREIFFCIKYSKDKIKFMDIIRNNENRFNTLDKFALEFLRTFTSFKIPSDSQKGGVNMCQAIKELMEDARMEGIREAEEKAKIAIIEATRQAEEKAEKAVIEATRQAEEKAVIETEEKTRKSMIESMRRSGIPEEAIALTLKNMKNNF